MLYQRNEKMNDLLFANRANGFSAPRIKQVTRTRDNLFFIKDANAPIDITDRYQNFADFKNDVKKLLLIPFVCLNLATVHAANVNLDAVSLGLDMLFLDCEESSEHYYHEAKSLLWEMALSTAYPSFLAVVYLADVLVEMSIRLAISLLSALYDGVVYSVQKVQEMSKQAQTYMHTPSAPPAF